MLHKLIKPLALLPPPLAPGLLYSSSAAAAADGTLRSSFATQCFLCPPSCQWCFWHTTLQ